MSVNSEFRLTVDMAQGCAWAIFDRAEDTPEAFAATPGPWRFDVRVHHLSESDRAKSGITLTAHGCGFGCGHAK